MTFRLPGLLLGSGLLSLLLLVPVPGMPASDKLGPKLRDHLTRLEPGEPVAVWVIFDDKGAEPPGLRPDLVTERSLRRRLKVRSPEDVLDATDLPVDAGYVRRVAAQVVRVRQRSKWFNAVSVLATPGQIAVLEAAPMVRSIDLVARFRRRPDPEPDPAVGEKPGAAAGTSLDYGASLAQVQQINVPALHDRGMTGDGVLIGHFDTGHRLLAHQVFASMDIVATWDFVDHDPNPAPPAGAPSYYGTHGIATLSVLGGFRPGELIGPAYGASYVLARTEDEGSETPVEEDNWIAAMEWADSLGVDITSTSLGYLTFDLPIPSYSWQDMNGDTARITQAADMAVARGIVVVNSAGNEGFDPNHNTLLAPADGDSVLSVGAVQPSGERATFSSVGPTTDSPPRIKPDIMAQGVSVRIASSGSTTGYGYSSGTSFSCPLAAGVAALLLSAHPEATPMQIRDALRLTANRASAPDNLYGWGIVNAVAALDWLDVATDTRGDGRAATAFRLEPAFPNPFNPSTTIAYELPEPSFVWLRVYDVRGRAVGTLVREAQPAGRHTARWNGLDDGGRPAPSGVYLLRLRAAGPRRTHTSEQKAVLVQ